MPRAARFALVLLLLIPLSPGAWAIDDPGVPYVWQSAAIALLLPPGWFALEATETADAHHLLLTGGDAAIRLTVLDRAPRTFDARPPDPPRWSPALADQNGRPRLDAALIAARQIALRYTIADLYGRAALAVESVSSDGARAGRGVAGLLPDERAIVVMADAPAGQIDGVTADRDAVIASLALGYAAQPAPRAPGLVWAAQVEGAADWQGVALDDRHVYGLLADGVALLNADNGAPIARIPFDSPAQATGIGAAGGVAFVGDRACRCIRRLDGRGAVWLDPIGVFGGGAPRAVTSGADGLIYAVDGDERGYLLRAFLVGADGTGEREGTRTLINGSYADAPPFAVASPDDLPHRLIAVHQRDRVTVDADGVVRLWRMDAPPIRYGSPRLTDRVPVIGRVSAAQPAQVWTFDGRANEVACLHATDPARLTEYGAGLDMALRLIAPDGTALAENDDHLSAGLFGAYDAALCPVTLPQDGEYTVEVAYIGGAGAYALALGRDRPIERAPVMRVEGTILEMIPVEGWAYPGRAGETVTLSMIATDHTLDSLLFVYAPDGSFLVSNDDALDSTLGVNAQIVQATLPADGVYRIAAGHWSGTGAYELVIVSTVP